MAWSLTGPFFMTVRGKFQRWFVDKYRQGGHNDDELEQIAAGVRPDPRPDE